MVSKSSPDEIVSDQMKHEENLKWCREAARSATGDEQQQQEQQ